MYFQLSLNVSIIICLTAVLSNTCLAIRNPFTALFDPCIRMQIRGLAVACPSDISRPSRPSFKADEVVLSVEMSDFQYKAVDEAILSAHKERVIFYRNGRINNKSGAKITDSLEKEFTRELKWEVVLTESVRKIAQKSTEWSIQAMISNMLEGSGYQITAQYKEMSSFTSEHFKSQSNSFVKTESESFKMGKSIEVPPYESVEFNAYYDRYSDVKIPFTAVMTITARVKDWQLTANELKDYLKKEKQFKDDYISKTDTALKYSTSGTVIGDFGVDTAFDIISVYRNSSYVMTLCNAILLLMIAFVVIV